MNRKKILFTTAACICLLSIVANPVKAQQRPKMNMDDFRPAIGCTWKGELTYLDYSSGKAYTMPAHIVLLINRQNPAELLVNYKYPDEPKADNADSLLISSNSTKQLLGEEEVISATRDGKGNAEIVTEIAGIDGNDNRKCLIRHRYIIGVKAMSIRKEVRFDGEEKFILRNEYKMTARDCQ